MIEKKTRAYIAPRRRQPPIPCFINGDLHRGKGVRKVMVYFFDSAGELVITLVPINVVYLAEFNLT